MRRKLLSAFFSIAVLLSVFSLSFAQETSQGIGQEDTGVSVSNVIIPRPEPFQPGFLGQDHSYSLVFRGNGEAIISLKVIMTNKTDINLTDISLRIPQGNPERLSVYQQIREPGCIRYDSRIRTRCLEYQDPDYYNYWGASKYQKAEFIFEGDTLEIALPQPIKPDKSGSYFVYFRAFGYANKNIFGAYTYQFESLKVNDDIRQLRIGISTDSDLLLKGVKGEVDYRFEEPQLASLEAAGVPRSSVSVDNYYQQIGYGQINKNTSNLAALESYKVTGAYAKNNLGLYAKELVIGLAIVLAFVIIFVIISRIIFKKLNNSQEAKKDESKVTETNVMLLTSTGVSFVSSLLIAAYTALVIFLGSSLTSVIGYRYQTIVVLFLVIISFAVYSLLLFAPAIYLGVKKGLGWGIAIIIATVIWLIIFLAITVFVLFFTNISATNPPVYPMMPLLEQSR